MRPIYISLFICLLAPNAFASSPAADGPKTVFVKVKETKLRSSPAYLAPSVSNLRFGDALKLVSADQGSWLQVSTSQGRKGFIHLSSVSDRKIVLSASKGPTPATFGASDDDVVLAGKGFSAEVEKGYAAKNSALNFSAVNSMENLRVSEAEVRSFVKAGGLKNDAL